MEQEKREMITYRLDRIDSTLEELKEIVVETRLQRNEIDLLKNEIEKSNKRVFSLLDKHSTQIDSLFVVTNDLNNAEEKKAATKWKFIVDTAFKIIIGAAIVALFAGAFPWLN